MNNTRLVDHLGRVASGIHNTWNCRQTHLNLSLPGERYILHSAGRVARKLEKENAGEGPNEDPKV